MKNAFYHAHIELMKFLLDKYIMLTYKDKNDFYDFNKRYNWNRYYGQESKEENYDEEFDDPKFIFYNVMDNSIHTNIEAFELILENGGNANARGKDGFKTILDYHAYEGHFEIVKILAEHGAKITETTFEKCKDYNSFYCLIDNAKTNWLSNNLEVIINRDGRPSGFFYYLETHPLKDISMYDVINCLSKALLVKNESVCIYILRNIEIKDKDDLDYFPDENEHWIVNAVEMNSTELV